MHPVSPQRLIPERPALKSPLSAVSMGGKLQRNILQEGGAALLLKVIDRQHRIDEFLVLLDAWFHAPVRAPTCSLDRLDCGDQDVDSTGG
jgi:hypothetical protein